MFKKIWGFIKTIVKKVFTKETLMLIIEEVVNNIQWNQPDKSGEQKKEIAVRMIRDKFKSKGEIFNEKVVSALIDRTVSKFKGRIK